MAKYRKEPETSVTDIIETRINKPSQVYNYRPDIDPGQDLSNYYTKSEVDSKIDAAVIHYQAGENVRISGSTISATDTTYQSSDFDIKYLSDEDDLRTTWSNKQDQLIAGNNISIDNNVISATIDPDLSEYYTKTEVNNIINGIDIPEYTAGTNVSIDANNVISATDTTYTASDFDIKDLSDVSNLKSTWSNKQDALTAGENVSISNNVISATDTTYTASDFDIKDLSDSTDLKSTWNNKQDALTAGSNVSINNNVISATDTTYQSSDFDIKDLTDSTDLKSTWNNKQDQLTAGNNITIENNVISANVESGNKLEQVKNLDNFQAEEGKIVQYIGETDSKYTNGYVYKKVGIETVIPAGTKYININDSTGNLSLVGIPNGTYYQVSKSDEDRDITSKIRYNMLIVSPNEYVATEWTNEKGWTPIVGVWGCTESVFSKVTAYYDDPITPKCWYARLENKKFIYSSHGTFIQATESSAIVLQNAQGVKIYAKLSGDKIQVLPLFYNENNDKYNIIAPKDTFEYRYYTTSEQIIKIYEWQRIDVQPANQLTAGDGITIDSNNVISANLWTSVTD